METKEILTLLTMFLAGLAPSLPVMVATWLGQLRRDRREIREKRDYDGLIDSLKENQRQNDILAKKLHLMEKGLVINMEDTLKSIHENVNKALEGLPKNIKIDVGELHNSIQRLEEVTAYVSKIRQEG